MNRTFEPKLKQTPKQLTQGLANIKPRGKEKGVTFPIKHHNMAKIRYYQKKYNVNHANIYEYLLDQLEDI